MKKIYNAPEASLLCFRPMEDLANDLKDFIDFNELLDLSDPAGMAGKATETSANDITINF
jgi:hypothetical protein